MPSFVEIGPVVPGKKNFKGFLPYTQIQTTRHNPRGLYYPGKSGDFHVTSFHFRVAKKQPQFNQRYILSSLSHISVNQKFVFLYGRNQISTLNNFRV